MAADSMPFGRVGIGCDSLSSAALQIKSQEPSLRGKVYYPPESPKGGQNLLARSSPEVCSAALHTHLPRARRSARLFLPCTPFVPHYGTPVTDSPRGIPIGMNVSGLYAPGVFLDFVPGHVVSAESAEPFGLVILAGSNPAPLHFIKEHPSAGPTLTPEALWPSTAIPPSCKRRKDRCTPLEPHPVRRLPRPTALPAHILRDSVRCAPRDSQDVEPTLTDARFRVLPGKAGITRPERTPGTLNYSGKFVNFVSQVWGLSRDSLACLIYTPLMVPPSSL